MLTNDKTPIGILIGTALLVASALIVPAWLASLLTTALAKGLVVLGVIVLMRAGLVSFGQGLYYCIGGYTVGLAGLYWGIAESLILLPAAMLTSGVAAAVIGTVLCRYREIFFAMFSLALSMILFGILSKAEALGSTDGFNVLKPSFFGFTPDVTQSSAWLYGAISALTGVVLYVAHRFLQSPMGFAGEAVRENEVRVEYLGVAPHKVLYVKYIVAAMLAGLGGGVTAFLIGHIDPEMSFWAQSGEFIFIALLGGQAHVAAPFIGAGAFQFIQTYALELAPETWQLILGTVLILVIVFMPKGLWSIVDRLRTKPGNAAAE